MKKFLLGFFIGLFFACLLVVVVAFAAIRMGESTPRLPSDSNLVLHLEGSLPEQAPVEVPLPFLQSQEPMTMLETYKLLHKAASDSRIKALVLEPRGLSVGWAKLQELRSGIQAFKKSGKPVYAFLRSPGSHEYYLATAADKIYMAPEDLLDVKGLRAELLYFKGTLDKLGVRMEFESIGKYKDAPDQYTRESARPETLEVMNQVLDQYYGDLVNVIAEGRKTKADAVKAALDQGPFDGKKALELGLVDKLIYEDEILPGYRDAKKIGGRDYARVPVKGFDEGTRIAVVTGDGEITRGETNESVSDTGITASGMVRVLKQVEGDSSIKGVILRIDSPGGDGIASDDILHEVKVLSSKKPVVISMSDTAASGGYFIAMTGDPIVAYPNTLTGSIGVFYGKPDLKGLFDKVGVKMETLSRGKFADIDSVYGPLNEEQRAKLKHEIEVFYQGFVNRVAEARKRPYDQVEPLAQGRVWLGVQAKQNGLIDDIGGFDRAVELVRQKAKVGATESVALVTFPPRRSLFEMLVSRGEETVETQTIARVESQIQSTFGWRMPLRILARGGMMHLMPFSIEVQ